MGVDGTRTRRYTAAMKGDTLQRLRRLRGMTQQDLADSAGVHQVSIARLERDKQNAGPHTMARLAKALGATIEELTVE